ncbi:efflux RND transporter periplasmic adaptor subunit [Agromyces sp. NPDC060279]|uniref:efflux RND transporter periplasmic adaptor subunit n=1 Tax=Agromyces sp. NPDC060279 TaxID=3347092 RepID=UPI00365D3618
MGVWRKWIFPIIRVVLVAVVAVALVKLAFFPDRAEDDAALQPGGSLTQPEVVVSTGTITNDLVLSGTVNADAAVTVKATGTGTVDEIFIGAGSTVTKGDKIFDIKVEDPPAMVEEPGPDGQPMQVPAEPTFHFEKVFAPANGVLSSLDVIEGQPVTTGAAAGKVAPPTFNVTATLSPEQQYRLTQQPSEATVAITGGPAPFVCTGLTIGTPQTGGGGDGEDGGGQGDGTATAATVRCAVPGDVRVFPGLAAEVTIQAGSAENVLIIPTTAVKGGAETGVVWLVDAEGAQTERSVKLGLSDGSQVAVAEGLAEGDTILEFVPGAPAVAPGMEGCELLPDGSQVCLG